jgi:two-component system nitrogen regulation sensor histidine kinase NtrY
MKWKLPERRRLIEIAGIAAVTLTLIGMSRLEARLYHLSEALAKDYTLFASILYYGIINLNVFLAILLSLLFIRNLAKLVVERRRGVFGSQLRTKLVAVLMVFSLVPTVLVFYVSTRFITKSFDEWFGGRVKETTQQTRDAGAQIYLQDQKRLESLAKIAASRVKIAEDVPFLGGSVVVTDISGFESEYSVQAIKIYNSVGELVGSTGNRDSGLGGGSEKSPALGELLSRFRAQKAMTSASSLSVENGKDLIRAAVPVRDRQGDMKALVVLEERFDTPVLANIQTILDGLSTLKPGAQLVRVSYLILLTVMTLLIVFGAVWFGFYVARAITGPLQQLAEATKEVALGNYAIQLGHPGEDETGQLTKAFNAMTGDLSRHKSAVESAQLRLEESNQELEKRRRYMEAVFENIASGIIAVDAKGTVTAFNEAALEMLGTKSRDPIGRDIREVLGEALYQAIWNRIGDDAPVGAREVELREFGIDATVFVAATHIEAEDGAFQGTVLVLDDATDRIRMQRATAWREVARRIAHEIKNPITPIRLSAERLLRRFSQRFEGEDGKVFESCVAAILVQVDALRSLVNEFSKFSRMPAINPRPSDLNAIVKGAIEVFRHGYPSIAFEESYAVLPELMVDGEQFNRVIVNLLSNAIDAIAQAGRPGVIRVQTKYDAALVAGVVEIADNGSGIPENIRDRVFEPYFSTKDSGTGLGLAVVNQIVNDHGGYIRMMSTGVQGTTFRIEIPIMPQVKL